MKIDIPTVQNISYLIEENIVLRKECQVLRCQLEQQRQEYEEKIRRRDEHRKKRKEEWVKTYNSIQQENDNLRVRTNYLSNFL